MRAEPAFFDANLLLYAFLTTTRERRLPKRFWPAAVWSRCRI
jgi:predicted nucleic acid-binding protein